MKIMTDEKVEEQPKPVEQPSDYDELDEIDSEAEPFIENEFGLKTHLIHSAFRDKKTLKLHDLVMKELCLSNIPDTELASVYAQKMDNIEAWLSMGFTDIAKSRLVRMLFRLQLLRGVLSNEGYMQYGQMSTSMTMERDQIERASPDMEEEPPRRSNPLGGLIRRVTKRR